MRKAKAMVRDKSYKYLTADETMKMKYAIGFKDYYTLSKTMKSVVMTKKVFLELCETAMDNDDLYALNSICMTYHQLWKQEVFDRLSSYMTATKKYWMFSFLDGFIDTVNAYHNDVNAWNNYIAETQSHVDEDQSGSPEITSNPLKKIVKFLTVKFKVNKQT